MSTRDSLLVRLSPPTFVLIWSTGWIVAGLAAPYADPLTFLSARYVIAALLVGAFAFLAKASWPASRAETGHALVSGVLLHGIYLGGVWWAVAQGVPAGISALIAALQPILTALLAPTLVGERIGPRQWLGVALGFAGIALVLAPKLTGLDPAALASIGIPLAVNALAMVSVTLGTFYQKRFIASGDLRSVACLQYLGAIVFTLPLALAFENLRIEWNGVMVATMAWSVLAISIGAIGLLLLLIRRGAVSKAAALIYLVPPTAAIMAYLFFGETLTLVQVVGMAVTAGGVYLVSRK